MKQIKKTAFLILSAILVTSCASGPSTKESKTKIGEGLVAHQYSDIYFSKQPAPKDIVAMASQNFKTIINLRHADEHEENEERITSEKVGIKYINIPFPKDLVLKNDYIKLVTDAVMKNRKNGNTLIHCSSGNRAAIWAGGHFYKDHGLSKEASVEMAVKLGLTKKKAKEKLRFYLERN